MDPHVLNECIRTRHQNYEYTTQKVVRRCPPTESLTLSDISCPCNSVLLVLYGGSRIINN